MRENAWSRAKERYNEIAPHVFDKVAGWSSIIGFILTIISIVNPDWYSNIWSKWFVEKWQVILVIVAIFLIIFLLLMALKYRNSVIIKMNALSRGFFYVMDKSLGVIESMENVENEIEVQDKKCADCVVKNSSIRILLNKHLSEYANTILNKISETFSEHVSFPVSTCIKMVLPSRDDTDEEQYVRTLARDEESNEQRKNFAEAKSIPISKNSDFLNIINGSSKGNGSAPCFYSSNLVKYSEELEKVTDGEYKYLNSNHDWKKYYIATMVVPIGMPINTPQGKEFKVWAFLCADSMSPKAFTRRQKTINIRLMRAFAGMISMVLKVYIEKWNKYSLGKDNKDAETGVK